jgi:hypothetical protein
MTDDKKNGLAISGSPFSYFQFNVRECGKLPTIAAAITAATESTATAAAATTTAVATAAATTATTEATATAAAFTGSLRTSFRDDHRTTSEICAVKRVDSALCAVFVCHFDKSETFRAASLAIHDDLCRLYSAVSRKLRLKLLLSCRKGKVADIQFLAHLLS